MNLQELYRRYTTGELDKPEFIALANENHKILHSYPEALAHCDIDEIRISRAGVDFHVASADLWMSCPAGESRVAPIEMINFRSYEAFETRTMLSCIGKQASILDIGANIGWYSLLFARTRADAQIHAFEPLPVFFDHLQANVRRNQLEHRVHTHRLGLSDNEGIAEFFIAPGNGTNASLTNVADAEGVETVRAEIRALDAWCAEQGVEPDFIKCDVEGAELLVVNGAGGILTECRPVVFLEILRKWCAAYDYHPNDIIEFMAGLGYQCYGIGSDALRLISRVDEATVETNYLFLHTQAHDALAGRLMGSPA